MEGLLFYLLFLLALIMLSAFFSGSETALFSVNRIQLRRLRQGTASERRISRLLRHPQRLLSTIVVGNMVVNILFASMVAGLTRAYLGERSLPVAILFSTLVLLLFGEVTPKTVAVYHALKVSRLVSFPLSFLAVALAPLRLLLQTAANLVLRLLRQKTMTHWDVVTKEEVAGMISLGEKAGVASGRERAILENILEFGEVSANDIMVPRNEVRGIDDSLTIRQAFVQACKCTHSRLPVYHRDMDGVWGIFSVVDMPRFLGDPIGDQPLHSLRGEVEKAESANNLDLPIYPAHVFPEMARLDVLLNHMKKFRVSMVLLVDEYGGTAGILTVEDILEEIVGFLAPAKGAEQMVVEDNYIMAGGRVNIRDFNRQAEFKLPLDQADTLGGYVMELLGRLPRVGDEVEEEYWRFRVVRMAGRRIGALRIEPRRPNIEKKCG